MNKIKKFETEEVSSADDESIADVSTNDENTADVSTDDNESAADNENMDDESEDESTGTLEGNSAWADAMSKVLKTATKSSNFIMSKAKKDSIMLKEKSKEIELVDDKGKVIQNTRVSKTTEKSKTHKELRKEMLLKQKMKADWESMSRVKPGIKDREKERELVKIATRGVMQLFNTVEKHQKTIGSRKEPKKEQLGQIKGNFMDMLKKNKVQVQDDPILKKAKKEETWSILKDDFMMGADMKDWDKEET